MDINAVKYALYVGTLRNQLFADRLCGYRRTDVRMATVPLLRLDTGPIRVLLVEDETFIRLDVAETLRRAGYEVIEAAKADAAMEFIEAGEQVDVVFTDVQTPGLLTGLTLAERIRAKFPMVPIIISSGNTNIEDAASRLGKFLPKPYPPDGIPKLIGEIVGLLP